MVPPGNIKTSLINKSRLFSRDTEFLDLIPEGTLGPVSPILLGKELKEHLTLDVLSLLRASLTQDMRRESRRAKIPRSQIFYQGMRTLGWESTGLQSLSGGSIDLLLMNGDQILANDLVGTGDKEG